MSSIEIIAFFLGIANVALVAKRSIWNYPFALAMVSLYAWLFYETKLYSDALLQLFFFAVNIYGWWNWARAKADAGEVTVRYLTPAARAGWLGSCALATLGWGALMHFYTDAAFPWWDASVAMMSVAAQILMSRRYVENWILWIAVDVDAIGLYFAKDLRLTALLYLIFLAISLWGLLSWSRARREATPALA